MTPLLFLGGGALLLYLISQSSTDAASTSDFREAIILDGAEGDEYEMVQSAIVSQVSPYDKSSLVVYYNDWQENVPPELHADINEKAKAAGIKGVAHIYGESNNKPWAELYEDGDLVATLESPDVKTWDDVVAYLDEKAAASVGMVTVGVASAGRSRTVGVAMAGRGGSRTVGVASAGKARKGADHMAGMFATRGIPRVTLKDGKIRRKR